MAVGNTFGATALTSYGGFWISFAITLTPGGFGVISAYGGETSQFMDVFGFYLMVRSLTLHVSPTIFFRTAPDKPLHQLFRHAIGRSPAASTLFPYTLAPLHKPH